MIEYTPTAADRARFPAGYAAEPRYLGYRDSEQTRPYAKYFEVDTRPVQEHVWEVLVAGIAPTEYADGIEDAARIMSRPGHHKMETGWTHVRRLNDLRPHRDAGRHRPDVGLVVRLAPPPTPPATNSLQRLAIRFTDPTRLGFDEPGPDHAVICARVGLSQYPIAQTCFTTAPPR